MQMQRPSIQKCECYWIASFNAFIQVLYILFVVQLGNLLSSKSNIKQLNFCMLCISLKKFVTFCLVFSLIISLARIVTVIKHETFHWYLLLCIYSPLHSLIVQLKSRRFRFEHLLKHKNFIDRGVLNLLLFFLFTWSARTQIYASKNS